MRVYSEVLFAGTVEEMVATGEESVAAGDANYTELVRLGLVKLEDGTVSLTKQGQELANDTNWMDSVGN